MAFLKVDQLIRGCLGSLRALGAAVHAELICRDSRYARSRRTRIIQLRFGTKAPLLSFEVRTTGTHLSDPLATGIIDEAKRAGGPRLLCAPFVPRAVGHRLAAEHVSYVDSAGNCRIETEGILLAHVEGRKRIRDSDARAPGIKSHQLSFALVAQPELVDAPVRRVALAAGIGKSAAFELLGNFAQQGLLDLSPGAGGLHAGRVLLERWLTAYVDVVRPSWLVTRCQPTLDDPFELEALISRICEGRVWALGGAAAASRMLATDRGADTILHLAEDSPDVLDQIRAIPAQRGSLTVLHSPGTVAYRGARPHTAHPLLVYTELSTSADPQTVRVAGHCVGTSWRTSSPTSSPPSN